ncbi:MAG TPA: nucleoside diphosphate kinase regulator [Candidatus Udaeobacter sp.]|jgi:regulator of nucleoside diphosphate kinase|nr:nucleoside diphosphate kinase regulator [Candidatus Udaeobacter sp.]
MNGALLGLSVVAAIGIILWAFLVIGGKLIETSVAHRRAFALGGRHMPSWILRNLEPTEDVVVDFVGHSPDLAGVLAVLTVTNQPKSFARIVHEIRIACARPIEIRVAANSVATALSILFAAGLIRLTRNGFVATDMGCEVRRRIGAAPRSTEQLLQNGVVGRRLGSNGAEPRSATRAEAMRQIHDRQTTQVEETNMKNRNIIITAADHAELDNVITFTGKVSERARGELHALEGELRRAEIVTPEAIPSDVITMNSRAELLDLETNEVMQFTLVLPRDAKIDEGKISVLAPLGTAMLGYRVGDEFEWHVPYGVRRLKVTNVYFQPEAELKKAA